MLEGLPSKPMEEKQWHHRKTHELLNHRNAVQVDVETEAKIVEQML